MNEIESGGEPLLNGSVIYSNVSQGSGPITMLLYHPSNGYKSSAHYVGDDILGHTARPAFTTNTVDGFICNVHLVIHNYLVAVLNLLFSCAP